MRELAERAEAAGLVEHWGRKVLEVRPPVALNKGRGVEPPARDADIDRRGLRGRRQHGPRRVRGPARAGRAGPPRGRGLRRRRAPTRRRASSRPRPTCSSTARAGVRQLLAGAAVAAAVRFVDLLKTTVMLSARRGDDARDRHRLAPRATPTTRSCSSAPAGGWSASLIGAFLGRRAQTHAADRPAARRRAARDDAARAPPGRRDRSTGCGRCWSRRARRSARWARLPAGPGDRRGFAIIWALAWRRQDGRGGRIEERDGVAFYVERTSPLQPMQLVRTPGLRREVRRSRRSTGTR